MPGKSATASMRSSFVAQEAPAFCPVRRTAAASSGQQAIGVDARAGVSARQPGPSPQAHSRSPAFVAPPGSSSHAPPTHEAPPHTGDAPDLKCSPYPCLIIRSSKGNHGSDGAERPRRVSLTRSVETITEALPLRFLRRSIANVANDTDTTQILCPTH